jgi:hypothetical protein
LTLGYTDGVRTATASTRTVIHICRAASTITRIGACPGSPNQFLGSTFELETPIVMAEGDVLYFVSYELSLLYPDFAPRSFAAGECPLKGYRGSGKIQRLVPYTAYENTVTNGRIYFLSDANKITPLPNYGTSVIAGTSLTALATVTPSYTRVGTGDYLDSLWNYTTMVGAPVAEVANVRQIAWGTTTQLYGVIEFDDLVTFQANAMVAVSAGLYYAPDIGVWEEEPPEGCVAFALVDSWLLTAQGMGSLPAGFALVDGTEVLFERVSIPGGLQVGGNDPLADSFYRAVNPFSGSGLSHDGYIYLAAIQPGADLYWCLSMDRADVTSTPLALGVFATHDSTHECNNSNPLGDFQLYADPAYPTTNFVCTEVP